MVSIAQGYIAGRQARQGMDLAQRKDRRDTRLADLAFREFETEQKAGRQKKLDEADALKASLVGGFAEMALQLPAEQRMGAFETFFGAATQNGVQWDESDMQGFNEALLPILEDDTKLLAFGRGLNPNMALPEGPSYNNPMAAFDPTTGEDVFIQSGSDGSVRSVDRFRPRPRDGQVIRMTGPDGQLVEVGSASALGDSPLSSSTTGKLQQEMLSLSDTLSNISRIEAAFDPQYLEYEGRIKATLLGQKDKFGADLDPDEKQFLAGYNELVASTNQALSAELNRLSGAAVSPTEEDRMRGFIPDREDGPVEYETQLGAFKRNVTQAYMRRAYLMNAGAFPDDVNELPGIMPLDSVKGAYDRRYNRERNRLEAAGMPPEEAKAEAYRLTDAVFGL